MKEIDQPTNKDNGIEPSLQERMGVPEFGEYKLFQQAVVGIFNELPKSPAASFTKPSSISRTVYDLAMAGNSVSPEMSKDYYTDVPHPFDISELSEGEFQQLLATFGPDIMRAKMVSQSVLDELGEGKILPVGGTCLIESWGLHLLNGPAAKEKPEFTQEVADRLIADAPYYSQVTGTMLLGGQKQVGVMYREEYPWWKRTQDEFGVKDSQKKAHAAYDRMFAAVERRGMLIDPQFRLVGIHFDDLRLEEDGYLETWMKNALASLPFRFKRFNKENKYDPKGYDVGLVRYTYSGPEILGIVQKLAHKQGVDLDDFTLHTRTKQLDHFREPTSLFKSTASLSQGEEERLGQYSEIAKLALDNYAFRTHLNGNGFLGFYDLTNNGSIVHQEMRIGEKENSIKSREDVVNALSSPTRLSSANLEGHLSYLKIIADSLLPEGKLILTAVAAERSIINQEISLEKKREDAISFGQLEELLGTIGHDRRGEGTSFVLIGDEKGMRSRLTAIAKEKAQKFFKRVHISQEEQSAFLERLVETIEKDGQIFARLNIPAELTDEDTESLIRMLSEGASEKKVKIMRDVRDKEKTLFDFQTDFASKFDDVDISKVREVFDFIPKPFPVIANPLVAHAIQLSFDPDMRQFVIDAQTISSTVMLDERNEVIRQQQSKLMSSAMQQIYPKMAAYLRYIMEGGDYPNTIRSQQTYNSVV